MGATTYVLLIRHGENDYTSSKRLAGRLADVRLNDKGLNQAQGIVKYLEGQPIDAIYSSPIQRCLETAAPLAAAIGLSVVADDGFVEVDYGEWQGASLADLSKLPEWQLVQHYPSLFRFPSGETLREVQSRAVAALERVRTTHPDQVVAVFSHGDIIRTMLAHYLGVPLDLFQRIAIATGSVSIFAFFDGRPMVFGMNYLSEPPKLVIQKPETNGIPSGESQAVGEE